MRVHYYVFWGFECGLFWIWKSSFPGGLNCTLVFLSGLNVNYEIVDNDIFTHPSWPFPVSPPREDLSLKCKVYQ